MRKIVALKEDGSADFRAPYSGNYTQDHPKKLVLKWCAELLLI